jgi:hypothetical protein
MHQGEKEAPFKVCFNPRILDKRLPRSASLDANVFVISDHENSLDISVLYNEIKFPHELAIPSSVILGGGDSLMIEYRRLGEKTGRIFFYEYEKNRKSFVKEMEKESTKLFFAKSGRMLVGTQKEIREYEILISKS